MQWIKIPIQSEFFPGKLSSLCVCYLSLKGEVCTREKDFF